MLHVMLGHGSGTGSAVSIRRDGDEVVVGRRPRPRQLGDRRDRAGVALADGRPLRRPVRARRQRRRCSRCPPRGSRRATTWRSSARSSTKRASRARRTRASWPPSGRPATSRWRVELSRRRILPAADRARRDGALLGRRRRDVARRCSRPSGASSPNCAAPSPQSPELARSRGGARGATSTSSSSDPPQAPRGAGVRRGARVGRRERVRASALRGVDLVEVVRAEVRALESRGGARRRRRLERTTSPDGLPRARIVARVAPRAVCGTHARAPRTPSRRRRAGSAVVVTFMLRRSGADAHRRSHRRGRRRDYLAGGCAPGAPRARGRAGYLRPAERGRRSSSRPRSRGAGCAARDWRRVGRRCSRDRHLSPLRREAPMRILVVEDSDSIRQMIETFMAARGHEVEAVSTGAKGIDAAFTRPPDAILLDLHLRRDLRRPRGLPAAARRRADARGADHRHRRARPTTARSSGRSRRAPPPTTRSPSAPPPSSRSSSRRRGHTDSIDR